MARESRGVRGARAALLWVAAAACACCFLASRGPASATPPLAMTAAAAQQKTADFVLSSAGFLIKSICLFSPAGVIAVIGYLAFAKRDQMTRKSWAMAMALLCVSVVLWATHVRVSSGLAAGTEAGGGGSGGEAMVGGPVHSGEVVVTRDGRNIIVPDPTKPEGTPVEQGWQRNLATSMTDAIKNGKEQVVMIFSRQGCPWCVRQLPVIYRAIEARAQELAGSDGAAGAAAGAAFVGGGAGVGGQGLLQAPIRAFILDAGEFPYLAQQFRIEAFPTSMFFGVPGATPILAKGYLNDEQLEEVLQAAALAKPEVPGQKQEGRPRKKRRGIFR